MAMTRPLRGFLSLLVITAVVVVLLAIVHASTAERVAGNRARALWVHIEALTGLTELHTAGPPPDSGESLLLADGRQVLVGTTTGYGGDIHYLVLLGTDLTIAGIRVSRHQETPGIADFIDDPRSDWMRQFIGKTSRQLPEVDGKSGATITSTALREAVHLRVKQEEDSP